MVVILMILKINSISLKELNFQIMEKINSYFYNFTHFHFPMQSINLEFHFEVPRKVIYEALTDQMKVMQYTRAPAHVRNEENSQFSMLDGKIVGKFLKLKPDEYIKMQWKFNDWSDFSTVQIILQDPQEDECDVYVNHTRIPPKESKEKIEGGWKNHIFQPMSQILGYPLGD